MEWRLKVALKHDIEDIIYDLQMALDFPDNRPSEKAICDAIQRLERFDLPEPPTIIDLSKVEDAIILLQGLLE